MLLSSVRDALRTVRHAPGYSVTVLLTLALTIGATTAAFSIVNGVLLKPLSYSQPDRLVFLSETWREVSEPGEILPLNARHFEYWRSHSTSFNALAQYTALPGNLTGAGDAAELVVVHASGSIFDVLQVKAALGRALTPADERSERADVVVLTDTLWRQRFGADRGVVGRPVAVDGRVRTIVGVLPAGFRLPIGSRLSDKIDAFVPLRTDEERVGWVGDHNNAAIGRLKQGVTADAARVELDVLQRQVSVQATAQAHEPVTLGSTVTPLSERIVGRSRTGLLLLLAAIASVLLIACSNLANLSLTRSSARRRQAAIRSALGAGQARLVADAIVEQALLSMAGGAFGVGVAWAALRVFVRTAPVDIPRVADVTLDGRVLVFAAAVSIVAGLFVGAFPAWQVTSRALQRSLRSTGTAVTGDRAANRFRSVLLAGQVSLSATLLVVTALLSISFVRLMNVDRGFDADRVLTIGVSLPASRYENPRTRLAAYDDLLGAVRALPSVAGVTPTSMVPLNGEGQVNFIVAEGDTRPIAKQPSANFRFVGPEFFHTLGMTIVRGRTFRLDERDTARPMPALVSVRTAAKLWPGEDPIGRHFSRGQRNEQGFEVVGLVADARTTSLESAPPLMVYVPYWWRTRTSMTLMIRTAGDPISLVPAIRQAFRRLDPEIAIGRVRPFNQLLDQAVAARRYQMRLFVTFGAIALAIALVGVYAVTAYGVSRRRREMNIRVALGATPGRVTWMVVRQGAMPIVAGLAGGTVGAVGVAGVVASLLFGVEARNPLVIASVISAVGMAGACACLIAARLNLTLNPARALREE
jgi:putative ABC transport system permease protein